MAHPVRILSVIGTRPEAVKMAPVLRLLTQTAGVESLVCVTAQHREMLDQVLHLFGIAPDLDLNLMQPDQSLEEITAAIFARLGPLLGRVQPHWVLAEGDTTTVMAAALLAYYYRVRFGHVEAGLRSGDKWQPFPEEINRRVAGVAADLHFAPTEWARQNLLRENVPDGRIVVTGNPVVDALQFMARQPPSAEARSLLERLGLAASSARGGSAPHLLCVTAHRRENFGAPLERICGALRSLAKIYENGLRIVYPVHLNPRVQEPVYRLLQDVPNITLLPPVDYGTMVCLLQRTAVLLTDSGGLQEEAPALGIPVLVLREITERPEGVAAGTARLVGTDRDRIVAEARRLLDNRQARAEMARAINPYGDGRAAERIVAALLRA